LPEDEAKPRLVALAKAGAHPADAAWAAMWIPAFAGMTIWERPELPGEEAHSVSSLWSRNDEVGASE